MRDYSKSATSRNESLVAISLQQNSPSYTENSCETSVTNDSRLSGKEDESSSIFGSVVSSEDGVSMSSIVKVPEKSNLHAGLRQSHDSDFEDLFDKEEESTEGERGPTEEVPSLSANSPRDDVDSDSIDLFSWKFCDIMMLSGDADADNDAADATDTNDAAADATNTNDDADDAADTNDDATADEESGGRVLDMDSAVVELSNVSSGVAGFSGMQQSPLPDQSDETHDILDMRFGGILVLDDSDCDST